MKFVFAIIFFLVAYNSQAQSETYTYKNYNTNKVGAVTRTYTGDQGAAKYDTIIQPLYDEILVYKNCIVLVDSVIYNKKASYYKGVTIMDSIQNEIKHFEFVDKIIGQFILEIKDKEKNLYSIYQNQYLAQKGTNSEFYLNEKLNFKCIVFHSKIGSQIFDKDGNSIIKFNEDKAIIIDYVNDKIQYGKKNYELYTFSGTLIEKDIKRHYDVESNYKTKYITCELRNGNQTFIRNDKVYFSNYEVKFQNYITNKNRIIYKKGNYYFVVDTLGKIINANPYQDMGLISTKSSSEVNWVKKDDFYFFVDNNLMPISKDKFYSLEELGGDLVGYKIKKNKSDQGYFAYNAYGAPFINEMVDNIYSTGYYGNSLVVQRNLKYAVTFDNSNISEFIYMSKPEIIETYNGTFLITTNTANESVLVDIYTYQTGGRFKGLGLTAIGISKDEWSQDTDMFILYKKDKFCFIMDYNKSMKDSTELTFEYENYKLDDETVFDYELIIAKKNGKWGLICAYSGIEASSFKYDDIQFDYETIDLVECITIYSDKKIGLLYFNSKSLIYEEKLKPIYDNVIIEDEMFILELDNKFGIMPIYDTIPSGLFFTEKPTSDFFYDAGINQHVKGTIDGKDCKCFLGGPGKTFLGQIVCYEDVIEIKDGYELYLYKEGLNYGLMTFDFDTLLTAQFDQIETHPNEDYLLTTINGKKGVRDQISNVIIPEKYDELSPDTEHNTDFVIVKLDERFGLYRDKELKLKLEYDDIIISDDFVYVKKDGKWGLFDHNLSLLKEFKYESLKELNEASLEE